MKSQNTNESDRRGFAPATVSSFADVSVPVWEVANVGWGSALQINITETPRETRWILQGRLFGPWVKELDAMRKISTRSRTRRKWIVVLNEVSFVDKDAEELLRSMSKQGARFIASGLYIERVLERLKIGVRKSLSGTVVAFFTALLPNV